LYSSLESLGVQDGLILLTPIQCHNGLNFKHFGVFVEVDVLLNIGL
jgi:hypothetical protein